MKISKFFSTDEASLDLKAKGFSALLIILLLVNGALKVGATLFTGTVNLIQWAFG